MSGQTLLSYFYKKTKYIFYINFYYFLYFYKKKNSSENIITETSPSRVNIEQYF